MLLRTDRATRVCYRTDGGQIVFGLPDSVAHARRPEDVAEVLRLAQRDHVPVTCRGGGLTTEGESVGGVGILLDVKGMNRLIDCGGGTAWVEAGMTWFEVAAALRPLGLDYTSAPLIIPWRGIPPRGVAPRSHTACMLARRALRSGRRARDLRHDPLGRATSEFPATTEFARPPARCHC